MSYDPHTPPSRTDHTEPPSELEHVTIEPDEAPAECAMFPRGGTEEQLHSQWITAHGRSFVELESMR